MPNHTIPHPSTVPLTLIDIRINLGHDSYDVDRDEVISRAEKAGVVQMIVTGASLDGSRKAIELAQSRIAFFGAEDRRWICGLNAARVWDFEV